MTHQAKLGKMQQEKSVLQLTFVTGTKDYLCTIFSNRPNLKWKSDKPGSLTYLQQKANDSLEKVNYKRVRIRGKPLHQSIIRSTVICLKTSF